MADRIGVINKGEIILVEEKNALMEKLGKKQLILHLSRPIERVPEPLAGYELERSGDGKTLTFTFHAEKERTKMSALLEALFAAGIELADLQTRESSLEEIFVNLVSS
jgi:ABC-2 type transport system ATP-binding protein